MMKLYDLLELIAEFSEDNLKLLNRFSKKTKNMRVSEDELPNFLNIRINFGNQNS